MRFSAPVRAMRQGVFAELEAAIAARRESGGDIVPLHIGDTHLAPPKGARIERAIAEASDPALYAYGATAGLSELRDALAAYVRASGRAHPEATEANVLVGVGATHALSCVARVVLDAGDDVLLASPYWPLAHGIITQTGARAVEVPLTSLLYEDESRDAGEILAAAATPRTRALYVISPNNPDGKVLSRRHAEQIARFAIERDLWVFSDEVYADYTYTAEPTSLARVSGMAERTLTAFSFSKSHALAGARVGYVVGPRELIAAARKVSVHTAFNVPVAMQRVALAALAEGEPWIANAREEYRRARDAAAAALEGYPVRFSLAEGGVYLFLDFADVLRGRPLKSLMEIAIARGVLLAPGESCGGAHATCARLCYTSVSIPRVLEGIARLREAVDAFSRASR
ncbi:MAG TPA: pyridoxal phosphate-dependent aminotransferase [Polyangiaceae bacterium]